MTKTIVALYDDIVVARQVVEDLVNAEFPRTSINLITNDAHNKYSRFLEKDYTPREDAVTTVEGAGFGAVVGALTGILGGLAALMIPGVGLVIVAGPIAAGLAGAVVGAATGGIIGTLVKTGVPEDDAPYYAEGIRRGGTLVSVETSDTLHGEDIMHRNGSINIHERINVWRQSGWSGFNKDTVENEDTAKSSPEELIPNLIETPNTVTLVNQNADPLPSMPAGRLIEQEPPLDEEDTSNSFAIIGSVPTIDTSVFPSPIPNPMKSDPELLMAEPDPKVEYEDITQ